MVSSIGNQWSELTMGRVYIGTNLQLDDLEMERDYWNEFAMKQVNFRGTSLLWDESTIIRLYIHILILFW